MGAMSRLLLHRPPKETLHSPATARFKRQGVTRLKLKCVRSDFLGCGLRWSTPFRVIKYQFGLAKVRYKGLAKNTAQLITLFALSNLSMARRQLMEVRG